MRSVVSRVLITGLAAVLAAHVGYTQQDREGCKDHPLLSRMSGYFIKTCRDEPFGSHKFNDSRGGRNIEVEGHLTFLEYAKPQDAPVSSRLEVIRNYTHAVEAIGGEVVYEGRYSATMKVLVGGREVWVDVLPGVSRSYQLYIVEKQAMAQQVVADAAALLADLDRVGHTVLRGVLFDTDRDVVKPESEPALTEIAKLLRDNPRMTAFIVGHTDMSGDFEHNLDLSNRRAAAVVQALVADHGISADRLTPRGVGPLAPVASNDSEEGRALNRRVELVKR
jgi:OOP family OmpA-OmpF porin